MDIFWIAESSGEGPLDELSSPQLASIIDKHNTAVIPIVFLDRLENLKLQDDIFSISIKLPSG
jgi:hypothetical protein